MKNQNDLDLSKVIPWDEFLELEFEDEEDRECGKLYYSRAQEYIESSSWCSKIDESYVGICQAEIIGQFLFKITPQGDVGKWFWVFVGNLPPAILPGAMGRNPGMALDAYIRAMALWVIAIDEGKPVDDLIPVNAPPTREYADMLRGRLALLRKHLLLDQYREDLDYHPEDVSENKLFESWLKR